MANLNHLPDNSIVKKTINDAKQNFLNIVKAAMTKSCITAGFFLIGASIMMGTTTADAASQPLAKTTYEATISNAKTISVKLQLNTSKKVTVKASTGVSKVVSAKQTGNSVKVKIKVTKAGTCKLKVSAKGMSTSTAKIKAVSSAKKVNHNISKSVSVAGYELSLGMSKSQVETALAKYGSPAYKGNGCESYDSECWYYQKEGSTTSFMVEFYNGSVERIVFCSPKWSNGSLSNSTGSSSLSVESRRINAGESDECNVYYYNETNGSVDFTMYKDHTEEYKKSDMPSEWYMCVLKDTSVSHSGKNSLAGTTTKIKWDLSKYDVNDQFSGKNSDLSKSKLIKQCTDLDNLALEKGKQEVYMLNMYRAFHGQGLAAYSEDSSQFAYINAKVRSLLKYKDHVAYFDGDFSTMVINKTIKTVRVNEWWSDWSQGFSENVGYNQSGTALDDVTSCISSTAHLQTMLSSNFSIGSAIVDGYSSVEMLYAHKMSDSEITKAQKSFLNEYNLTTVSDSSQICAGLYRDSYSVYTFTNVYELATMSKTGWIDYVLDKYDLRGSAGAEEYLGLRYDKYYQIECNNIYLGKKGFYDGCSDLIERGYMTEDQVKEAYLYFCKQVYNQDYNKNYLQALMNHFNCTEEEVYLKHSDVTADFSKIAGSDDEIISTVKSMASKYGMSVETAAEFYVRSHTNWSERLANETRGLFGLNPVYSD